MFGNIVVFGPSILSLIWLIVSFILYKKETNEDLKDKYKKMLIISAIVTGSLIVFVGLFFIFIIITIKYQ